MVSPNFGEPFPEPGPGSARIGFFASNCLGCTNYRPKRRPGRPFRCQYVFSDRKSAGNYRRLRLGEMQSGPPLSSVTGGASAPPGGGKGVTDDSFPSIFMFLFIWCVFARNQALGPSPLDASRSGDVVSRFLDEIGWFGEIILWSQYIQR